MRIVCEYVCTSIHVYVCACRCDCPRTHHRNFPPQPPEPEDKEAAAPAEISLINKLLHSKGLVTNAHDIEVMRKDPTSPLYSAKSFEQLRLKPNLLKGLYGMGFNKPSKIQESALPLLLADP